MLPDNLVLDLNRPHDYADHCAVEHHFPIEADTEYEFFARPGKIIKFDLMNGQ